MTTPVLSVVESDRHQEAAKNCPPDWLRLVAIWSWLHRRPHATFQEFLDALPAIDAFVSRGRKQ